MKPLIQQFTHSDLQVLDDRTVWQGYFQVKQYRFRHRLFNGGWAGDVQREVFLRGCAVGVLPFDALRNQVILIEQFRIGALNGASSPWLFEIVAGMIEDSESHENVAHREAQEEAGVALIKLLPICDYWASPGATSEQVTLFCGQVDAATATGIHGIAAEHEDIRVHVVDLADAFAMAANNQIKNSPTIIALQWLQINLEKVRQQFQNNAAC